MSINLDLFIPALSSAFVVTPIPAMSPSTTVTSLYHYWHVKHYIIFSPLSLLFCYYGTSWSEMSKENVFSSLGHCLARVFSYSV